MTRHTRAQRAIASSLLISLLGFTPFATPAFAQQMPAYGTQAAASDYTPPTADQLYQMVAPIALFPDPLVALVLASATYPDQITGANDWLTQNPGLKDAALVDAANQQPWDPSVKALTGFPAVLSQMSSNMAWTTALGQAYYNDPSDVLNAVQVMRQRARAAGHLSSNRQMVVTTTPPTITPQYVPAPDAPLVYDGPAIVPPPPETIVIEPAQPDVVYVPAYNPAVVYGAPITYYPGYVYEPPVLAPEARVTVGLISFGVGIAVGAALFSHVGWGWHNWGMHWAPPPSVGPRGPDGGWRPSVVYNHTTYISRTTTTIINRYNRNRVVNNYGDHRPTPQQMRAQQINEQHLHAQQMPMQRHPGNFPAPHAGGAMTMPHFNADDTRPGKRPTPPVQPDHSAPMHRMQAPAARPEERQFDHGRQSQETAHAPMRTPHSAEPAHEAAPRAPVPHPVEPHNQPQYHSRPQPQFHPQPQAQYHPAAPQPFHPQAQPRPQPHPAATQPAPHAEPHLAPHREEERK